MPTEQARIFVPADYAVLKSPKEENLSAVVAEHYVDAKGQLLDQSAIDQATALLARQNIGLEATVPADTPLILPTSLSQLYFFKKGGAEADPPAPPKEPPHPPKQSAPPDKSIPIDPIWDWAHRHTVAKGPTVAEGDGCKGHIENVVEKDGTQEQRSRAGSFVFLRVKETEGKDIIGVPIKTQYVEIVRAARFAVRTWQLQRTARYFVEVCPPDNKEKRTLQSANEPMWVQLDPDEYIAGPPEEVLAVETGPVGPGGTITGRETSVSKGEKWAKDYERDHPGVIYEPALDGKEIK